MNLEDKVKELAIQYCYFNTFIWPDNYDAQKPEGFEEMSGDEQHKCIRPEMDKILYKIQQLTYIDPWLIINYYWNCEFLDHRKTVEEWIKWIFYGKISATNEKGETVTKYIKDGEVCGYQMKMQN